MKKILVTGGSGFIGSNLVNFLLKKKKYVVNIDKLSNFSTPEKFKPKIKNYKFKHFDLKDKKKLGKVLSSENFDTIVHLAAESHVDRSIDSPRKFFLDNIISNTNFYDTVKTLVDKKKIKKPRIIHISTDEVYGSVPFGASVEQSKIFTSSPYSGSKAACENFAQAYMETFNLKICVLRITNNYGPYQFPEKFLPKSILRISYKKKIPLYGQGKNIREWIYVTDTCEAIYKVIQNFKNKETFNVGSSHRFSNISVLKILFKKLKYPLKNIEFVKDRPGHDLRYALNSTKFKKAFNWKPKVNLTDGINKTIIWYKKNKNWLKEINKNYKDKRLGKIEI